MPRLCNMHFMIEFFEYDAIPDSEFAYAVVAARHAGKWVFCKNKTRLWEIPGGHRDAGEEILHTAQRELFEETGALSFSIKPAFAYLLTGQYGAVFTAEIETFGPLPAFEIERIDFFTAPPADLTFPHAHPFIIAEAAKFFE